ncbi:polysaccharide biosynthesis/export family protein [Allosphingosinicella deserti]|nr:polysaccharide biosynthesis/export family protein [Sphingomonas deserti]
MASRLLTMICCVLALAGCSPSAVVSPGERVAAATAIDAEYRLGVGDRVKMNVFNEAALSGEFAVNDSGNISLPLIGDIPATGKTPAEVARVVETRLADGYLREPKVSMEVAAYRPFYILGEVKSPGQYPYASGLTVLNAIATAQGFTPRAEKKVVFIRKFGTDVEEPFKLTPDLKVYPGDTIRLGERFF